MFQLLKRAFGLSVSTSETRSHILDAAERRFAQTGYDGTSIRDITGDAGVNVAAIHYHFGGKEELLRGVTDHVVVPLNRRRFDLLDALLAVTARPSVAQLVEAFVRPDIETLQQLNERGPNVARFLGRIYSDQTPWIREMTKAQFAEVGDRFAPLFAQALPELTEDELTWRVQQMVAVIVMVFATWPEHRMSGDEAELLIRRLIAFLSAGLEAETTPGR